MSRLPDDPEQVRMSFSDHLEELRGRLLRGLGVFAGLFFLGWVAFIHPLERAFLYPHLRAIRALARRDPPLIIEDRLSYLTPVEPVFFQMKVCLVMALLFGFPYLLHQLWGFIAVGLYPKERRLVLRYLPHALLCGAAGILFGYFVLIPLILEFLYAMPDQELFRPNYRLADYFAIFLMFTASLALIFQLPLILLGLGSAGVADAAKLRKYRRHFILASFVVAAVITPPDAVSQVFMALPMVFLYEIGILLVALRRKRAQPAAAAGGRA